MLHSPGNKLCEIGLVNGRLVTLKLVRRRAATLRFRIFWVQPMGISFQRTEELSVGIVDLKNVVGRVV